jgi:hypothetical protein
MPATIAACHYNRCIYHCHFVIKKYVLSLLNTKVTSGIPFTSVPGGLLILEEGVGGRVKGL